MTIIDESLTAKGYTPAALVPAAFGTRRTIDEIVIHHWGERGQSHDGVVNFFVNGPGQTSAHYVVSAGRIHCLVSPEDAAWHCPGKNASTIGIECRPEATDADYATVVELIRTLRAQYGNLPLSKHRDWYNTACPGVWDLNRLNGMASVATITTQSSTITPIQEIIMALTTEDAQLVANAILDQRRGSTLGEMVNEYRGQHLQIIAAIQGIDTGGAVDPAAIAAAIPAGIAKAVADELVKRLGN